MLHAKPAMNAIMVQLLVDLSWIDLHGTRIADRNEEKLLQDMMIQNEIDIIIIIQEIKIIILNIIQILEYYIYLKKNEIISLLCSNLIFFLILLLMIYTE